MNHKAVGLQFARTSYCFFFIYDTISLRIFIGREKALIRRDLISSANFTYSYMK